MNIHTILQVILKAESDSIKNRDQRNRIRRTPRQEILEATGRPETKTGNTAVRVANLELVKKLKEAAQ